MTDKKRCDLGRQNVINGVGFPTRCLLEFGHEGRDNSAHWDGEEHFITFPVVPGSDPTENNTVRWVAEDPQK